MFRRQLWKISIKARKSNNLGQKEKAAAETAKSGSADCRNSVATILKGENGRKFFFTNLNDVAI